MGTGYKLNPSEINNHNKMCYTKVPPMAILADLPPPTRPAMTSPVVKTLRRNLFGSCGDGEIDKMLSAQQEKDIAYVKRRYNFDLKKIGENCNPQISTYNSNNNINNKSESDSDKIHLAATLPYARIPGLKGTFRVRKAHDANSNVPKRITNNLSSEMGTTTTATGTGQQQQQQQQQQQKQSKLELQQENKNERQ